MAKVTSKYQVSIPKTLAEQLAIKPGDDIQWRVAGDELRISPARPKQRLSREERLARFDAATSRQSRRDRKLLRVAEGTIDRGWTREDLYDRDRTR
ncbi:MAG TPA: AbrB/MazE/SpoVT family DNA-binding domain-containing protein [Thermoanaerobaculia bacterium]|nr:AbrB/MazE/SpoVT family DNA-binding domain-containing protein [Thermoanaerobaculia bacterium]